MTLAMFWFILTVVATGLMWVPYVLDRTLSRGLVPTLGYPGHVEEASPWAERAKKAHRNAIENLVLLASLVLAHHLMVEGQNDVVVGQAVLVFFVARIVHYVVYTAKISYVRTLSFFAGYVALGVIVVRILTSF